MITESEKNTVYAVSFESKYLMYSASSDGELHLLHADVDTIQNIILEVMYGYDGLRRRSEFMNFFKAHMNCHQLIYTQFAKRKGMRACVICCVYAPSMGCVLGTAPAANAPNNFSVT